MEVCNYLENDVTNQQSLKIFRRLCLYPKLLQPQEDIMEVDSLFKDYTVEEIRKIEKDTRAKIEKKKEDLRQMVGERYRDLIEAADTITDMKKCTSDIVNSVEGLQKNCTSLQKTMMTRGVVGLSKGDTRERDGQKKFYSIAAEIKLLVDIPDRLWSALEKGHHLQATQLYLLACHVTKSLQLDSSTPRSAHLLKRFPVLTRQFATISHFKEGILQSSRKILKDASKTDQDTAEALCSILLLEDSSPRQVFAEFLLARKAALQTFLGYDTLKGSIKNHVCQVMEVTEKTLRQIYSLFYCEEQDGDSNTSTSLVLTILSLVASGKESPYQINLDLGNFGKYIPDHIKEFRPTLRASAGPISSSYLQQSVEQWVETCIGDVQHGVAKSLRHVTTIKGLTGIRDAVHQLLEERVDSGSPWKVVCEKILRRKLCLWGEFLRSLFITRIQALIQDSLDAAISDTQVQFTEAMEEIGVSQEERNICDFIWKECPTDVPSQSAWDKGASVRQNIGTGGLAMKTRAFTPVTQSISTGLNERLGVLLDDLQCYTVLHADRDSKISAPEEEGRTQPFDRFADNTVLHSFTQITATRYGNKLADFAKERLKLFKEKLEAPGSEVDDQSLTIDRVLLLGRLCWSVIELCTHLQTAVLISHGSEPNTEVQKSKGSKFSFFRRQPSKSTVVEENDWTTLQKSFQDQRQAAYSIWSNFIASGMLAEFRENLAGGNQSLFKATTRWDVVEIQEETEDGKKVASQIHLPVQTSWFVQSLLFNLCEEINRIGGHALSSATTTYLVRTMSQGLMDSYQTYIKNRGNSDPITQSQALQLLFDVKFIYNIMSGRGDDKKINSAFQKQFQKLCDDLEAFIDPFDLDVFNPHLIQKLNSHTQRCTLLFGALANPDKHMYSSYRAASSTYQEQHNILPVSSSQVRFNLLPLSTPQTPILPVQPTIPRTDQEAKKSKQDTPSAPPVFHSSGGMHKSQTVPASLSARFGSLKPQWLSNLGGQSK